MSAGLGSSASYAVALAQGCLYALAEYKNNVSITRSTSDAISKFQFDASTLALANRWAYEAERT